MSTQKKIDEWDRQVNALIDGELSAEQERRLRQTALDNPELQQLLERSSLLQEAIAHLSPAAVSTEFQERLRAIPGESARAPKIQTADAATLSFSERVSAVLADSFGVRGFSIAFGLAVLGLFITSMSTTNLSIDPAIEQSPSTAEIAQAQKDLDVALQYLVKANRSAQRHLVATVDKQVTQRVQALVTDRSPINVNRYRLNQE